MTAMEKLLPVMEKRSDTMGKINEQMEDFFPALYKRSQLFGAIYLIFFPIGWCLTNRNISK